MCNSVQVNSSIDNEKGYKVHVIKMKRKYISVYREDCRKCFNKTIVYEER